MVSQATLPSLMINRKRKAGDLTNGSGYKYSEFKLSWLRLCAFEKQTVNKKVTLTCRLCKSFGREEREHVEGEKKPRRRSQTIMAYHEPKFRTDHFKKHLCAEHPKKYAEYKSFIDASATTEAIDAFFSTMLAR
jgi:hypothetical protein